MERLKEILFYSAMDELNSYLEMDMDEAHCSSQEIEIQRQRYRAVCQVIKLAGLKKEFLQLIKVDI